MSSNRDYAVMDPFKAMEPPPEEEQWSSWRTKGAWRNWKALGPALPYLRPYRKLYMLAIFFTLIASVIALAEPWPLAIMIDSVIDKHKPGSIVKLFVGSDPDRYLLLGFVVAAGFLIVVIGHGISVIDNYVSAKLEQNMILDLRSDLFNHSQGLSLTFHDERFTGQLMALINNQASALGEIVMAFPPLLQNALTLIGMLTIALLIDWQVTLISLVAIPFIYYALGLYGTRIVPRVQQVMRLEWGSMSIVYEAMSMLRVIVSFGREKHEFRRFRKQGQTAVDARVSLTVRQTLFSLAVTAATAAGTSLVLGFGAWHVLKGEITTGEMLVLISYIAAAYQPLETISTTVGNLHQQFVFLNASLNLLKQKPEIVEDPEAVDIGRAKGRLTLEDVSFAYKDRKNTLQNISFDGHAGQRIAIVGPTGAGKTTLVNLLVRFYDPESGRILIDGTEVTKLKLQCLREQISVVLQEPLLFSGTIAENIRYGRLDATMDEIAEAATRANAHDFISNLPEGYETELGEGAHQLSGGERQRICVARAFIKDAPILILDEPTSSIDSKTEAVILDALEDLMVGRTSIMIAHRLSTIRDADMILVLNHGQLVEQGSHEELLAYGGLYKQLYDAQTRVKSRAVSEGGAAYEGQLIDTITQELGDQAYAATGGNGAPHPKPPEHTPRPAPANDIAWRPQPATGNGGGEPPKERPRITVKILDSRDDLHCDICGRALLKGEVAEPFVVQEGVGGKNGNGMQDDFLKGLSRRQTREQERRLVCELCWPAAERSGWTPLPFAGGRA
jgi:ATP-binding cassette subfamily B protein